MKKLIAFVLAAFALNASAFTGTGNEKIEDVRNYVKVTASGTGTSKEIQNSAWWLGVVAGLSHVFAEMEYPYSICYPKDANVGQLADIAAKYIVDHPEKRTKTINALTWLAHNEAFGTQNMESCWSHDRWLKYNS